MKAAAALFVAAAVVSCSAGAGGSQRRSPLRILALGDSYTIGESVSVEDRWPVQLAEALRNRGLNVEDPQIIARTGWTTDELTAAIDAAKPQGPFDLVTLLIGVNNQYRGREVEQYRGEFAELLQAAIAYAGGDVRRVIVVSIPDWGVTPFAEGRDRAAIAAAIDRYNAVNKEETLRAGSRYVDITPGSRRAATDRSLVAADGLHPSGAMYREWTAAVLPEALDALR